MERNQEKSPKVETPNVFFVVPACHELVLDGSINIFQAFHSLSAVD